MNGITRKDATIALVGMTSKGTPGQIAGRLAKIGRELMVPMQRAIEAMEEFGIVLSDVGLLRFKYEYKHRISQRDCRRGRMQKQGVPRHKRRRIR